MTEVVRLLDRVRGNLDAQRLELLRGFDLGGALERFGVVALGRIGRVERFGFDDERDAVTVEEFAHLDELVSVKYHGPATSGS